jgi:hypothetical protein
LCAISPIPRRCKTLGAYLANDVKPARATVQAHLARTEHKIQAQLIAAQLASPGLIPGVVQNDGSIG